MVHALRPLSSGGTSLLYRGTLEGGPQAVLKVQEPRSGSGMLGDSAVSYLPAGAGVAQVLGSGSLPDGREYVVMPFCAEGSLADFVRLNPPDLHAALRFAVQLCNAVAHVHAVGILHRDIKPSNVLIDDSRSPLLSDFGASTSFSSWRSAPAALVNGYSAPESVGEVPVFSPSSDQFMLGRTIEAILPKPDASLSRILEVATAERAEDRFPSALDLGRALQDLQAEHDWPVTPLAICDDLRGPCGSCAHPVRPDSRFCENCGAATTDDATAHVTTADTSIDAAPPDVRGILRLGEITLGRSSDCDLQVTDALVSRIHAVITFDGQSVSIRDAGSSNGTFVNGAPITAVKLKESDTISLGNTVIRLEPGPRLAMGAETARGVLRIENARFDLPSGRTLVKDVSLTVAAGQITAVIGPSGAGKTTLMTLATGQRRPTGGSVTYANVELWAHPDFRNNVIGFVPQDDVIHRALGLKEALIYGTKLRLPADTSSEEAEGLVDEVLQKLGLATHAQTPIHRLSGGQRKRASVALELVTNPPILVLDEPTSGLDPNTARDLLLLLRELADAGQAIVVVTHSPADLDHVDQVVLLGAGGLPAAIGSPSDVLASFHSDDWPEVYRQVSAEGGDPIAAHRRFLSSRGSDIDLPPRGAGRAELTKRRVKHTRQFATVLARQFRLLSADRGGFIFLFAMPLVLGLLAFVVPGTEGFRSTDEVAQLFVITIVGACFSGLAVSIRDLVAERPIYLREVAGGLRPLSYMSAKAVAFSAVAAVQSLLLVVVVTARKPAPTDPLLTPSPWVDLLIVVTATAVCSVMMGLLVSSLVRSMDQVMPALVIIVMGQLVLCGGLVGVPVTGRILLEPTSWLTPSRWGFAGGASLSDIKEINPALGDDVLWTHDSDVMLASLIMLLALSLVFFLASLVRVSRERAM